MKRALYFLYGVVWISVTALVVIFLKDANWLNSRWKSALALLPDIAVPVIAFFELRHSAEANEFRFTANRLGAEANGLRKANNDLEAQIANLNAERNAHLEQIAENTKRPRTQGERNAALLRVHSGENAVVDEGSGSWGSAQVAEVNEDNIVTLFVPSGQGTEAWAQPVHCDDLDVVEVKQGDCNLRLNIRKRLGRFIKLGQIKKYEDRMLPVAEPPLR